MKRSSLLVLVLLAAVSSFAQETYTFVLGGGGWDGEISMDVIDPDNNTLTTLYVTPGTDLELVAGCYTLIMYDSYGDGWNGATYSIYDSSGALIAFGDLDTADSGDGQAIGYDDVCVPGEPMPCESVSIYTGGGSWDSEISWFIQDEDGNTLVSGSGGGTVNACLPSGCYTLVMEDSFGDGWNGAVYIIIGPNDEVYAMGGLEEGAFDMDNVVIGDPECAPEEPANYSAQDCMGAITLCSDQTFGGNADAYGDTQELNVFNSGCLWQENQSGWYIFSPTTEGTISFTLTPSNGIDYDFAIWGPYEEVDCPPMEDPLRCSYSALYEPTGLEVDTAEEDYSESPAGDAWVEAITVTSSDLNMFYIMLIDNFTADNTAFDFEWGLDGVLLDCSISLPVELVEFHGTEGKDAHILEWQTQTELNNAYFEVERSRNGNLWQTLAHLEGHGNSTVPHYYRFDDVERPYGTTYYRLRQVDFNGAFEYSETIALRHLAPFSLDKIYPNPSREATRLLVKSDVERTIDIQIYDCRGRLVHSQRGRCAEGTTAITLDTSGMLPGYYQLIAIGDYGERLGRLPIQRL